MLQKKTPPRVSDPDIAKALQHVYDDINQLINSVNLGKISEPSSLTKGETGETRLTRQGSGNYYLEGLTDEGWIRSVDKINVKPLTNSTSGTVSDTIGVIDASYDAGDLRNQLASLTAKINEIINSKFGFVIREKENL
tara:strand:+ start:185 stop:598 length:414 start_codon:yes stop_codon:yes gene_type:complete